MEGRIAAGRGTDDLRFRPARLPFLSAALGLGSRPVRAYGCPRCHHLQLAVDFSEEESQKFIEFEGQQPGVLERLADEAEGPEGRDD